jgi:hypothetical protein
MRKAFLGGSLIYCVLLAGLIEVTAQQGNGNESQSEIQRGFEIAPVPLNLNGKNRGLVGLGSYLVNGPMDCLGCHTSGLFLAGGDPFLGQPEMINTAAYLGGGVPFGPFISRNLTPDANGLPGGLTFEQFEQVIRMGTDFKAIPPHVPGNPGLLQVMPWPSYRNSTDRVVRAIYEYLSAIPCIEGGPGLPPNRC